MLPGELQAKYGSDPAYQNYLNWHATGAKHPTWEADAQAAAEAQGMKPWLDTSAWTSRTDDWGEQRYYDAGGAQRSSFNPAFWQFVQNWRPTAPPAAAGPAQSAFGNPAGTAPPTIAAPAGNASYSTYSAPPAPVGGAGGGYQPPALAPITAAPAAPVGSSVLGGQAARKALMSRLQRSDAIAY